MIQSGVGGKGTLNITVKEVDAEYLKPIPAGQLELFGVKLEEKPFLPDLRLEFDDESHQATISIVIAKPDSISEKEKVIVLDTPLPFRLIPDAAMSIKDIMAEGMDAEALIENTMTTLLKRIVKIRFERRIPGDDNIEITLFVSSFESQAVCPISDLVGFIHQIAVTETSAEWNAPPF